MVISSKLPFIVGMSLNCRVFLYIMDVIRLYTARVYDATTTRPDLCGNIPSSRNQNQVKNRCMHSILVSLLQNWWQRCSYIVSTLFVYCFDFRSLVGSVRKVNSNVPQDRCRHGIPANTRLKFSVILREKMRDGEPFVLLRQLDRVNGVIADSEGSIV